MRQFLTAILLTATLFFTLPAQGMDYCPNTCMDACDPICYDDSCSNECGAFGAYGSFLWWGMYGDELDYGATVTETSDGIGLFGAGVTYAHTFDWKPGVRLGVFYQTPCQGIDLAFEWTYYRNKNTDVNNFAFIDGSTIFINSVYVFEPFPDNFLSDDTLLSATLESSLSFRYNHFLLKYGAMLNATCALSLHPYVGAVYYQTNEDISVGLTAVSEPIPGTFLTDAQVATVNTQAHAPGAKIGIDFSYDFVGGLSLIADLGLTGAAANFSLNQRVVSTLSEPTPGETTFTSSINKWEARAIFDLSLGFRYSTCLCNNYLAFAQLEWEYHHFFNQTSFIVKDMSFDDATFSANGLKGYSRSSGDLILHGLSVTVGVAF